MKSSLLAGFIGLVIGDTLGAYYEFQSRHEMRAVHTTDILKHKDGGTHDLKKGQYTDDTSMALCIAVSLITIGGYNAKDIMKNFSKWMNNGFLASNHKCFDIGATIHDAILNFESNGNPYSGSTDVNNSSNGCIMRLIPIVMYFSNDGLKSIRKHTKLQTKLTHGSQLCIDTSDLMSVIIYMLTKFNKNEMVMLVKKLFIDDYCKEVKNMFLGLENKKYEQLNNTGYVITTLESALWCFLNTNNFVDGLILVIRLGKDTDTQAAVYGQIAGTYYGLEGIPQMLYNDIQDMKSILEIGGDLLKK